MMLMQSRNCVYMRIILHHLDSWNAIRFTTIPHRFIGYDQIMASLRAPDDATGWG